MPASRTISIDQPDKKIVDGEWVVSTTIHVDQQSFHTWYRSKSGPLADGVETFVAASLLPAMKLGYALKSTGPISTKLLQGLKAYQRKIQGWYQELKIVPILAEPKSTTQPPARGAGSFFSCGVDACYTFLKNYQKLTAGILIHGFEKHHTSAFAKDTVSALARNAAEKLKRPLIEVETNIRTFCDQYAEFDTHYHGSILASVALLLTPQLGTVYIPSSYHYDDLFPWASHPELDPLWSTESTQIIHDGCNVTRSQKVDLVAQNDTALSVLRVCIKDYRRSSRAFNCGRCEKCIRTMVDLRIAGALDRCPTFQRSLKLKSVSRVDLRHLTKNVSFYKGSLKQLKHKGGDPALQKALEECLSGEHYRGLEGLYRDTRRHVYRDVLRPMLRPIERTARMITGTIRRKK